METKDSIINELESEISTMQKVYQKSRAKNVRLKNELSELKSNVLSGGEQNEVSRITNKINSGQQAKDREHRFMKDMVKRSKK